MTDLVDPKGNVLVDDLEGFRGRWMATASGGRFYPQDIRQEEIKVNDIANGIALEGRYNGQHDIELWYSVAEHCFLGAMYFSSKALDHCKLCAHYTEGQDIPIDRKLAKHHHEQYQFYLTAAWAFLFHDAAEGLGKDLNRAWKAAVPQYKECEDKLQAVIEEKYGITEFMEEHRKLIKEVDCRMVPVEKAVIMSHVEKWSYDQFEPLDGIHIQCWERKEAKAAWCMAYIGLARALNKQIEPVDIPDVNLKLPQFPN